MSSKKNAVEIIDVEVRADRPGLVPEYQSEMAAGLDLVANIPSAIKVARGETVRVPTGIRVNMLARRDAVGLVFPRSGAATKRGLVLANTVGVIDADYHGEIILMIRNQGVDGLLRDHDEEAVIEPADRLAQLVFLPILIANLLPVEEFSTSSARGEGGFGSTGRHAQFETEGRATASATGHVAPLDRVCVVPDYDPSVTKEA